jgi:hypothetical protein
LATPHLDLGLVIYEAAQVAERITPSTRADIINSQSLCGQIPGRNRVKDYGAAPNLLQTISAAFTVVIPNAEQTSVFSTRIPALWLASCYTQHLRASRMSLSAEAYVSHFRPSSQLDKVVQDYKTVLALHDVAIVRVAESPPLDLLDRLLDLSSTCENKRSDLVPVPSLNKAPTPAQVAALLEINQSSLSDKDARDARMRLTRGLA